MSPLESVVLFCVRMFFIAGIAALVLSIAREHNARVGVAGPFSWQPFVLILGLALIIGFV